MKAKTQNPTEIHSSRAAESCREAALLEWYDLHKRDLPWRREPVPYHIWLSEIMLQQTRVEAVKEYYHRFLTALPDISSLAMAEEDFYLKLWQGLGYYSRVRNLHRAAVMILRDFDGRMPETSALLKKLPGIGDYTAAAIASIAFRERIPAIDGNLLRIFSRLTEYGESIREPAARKAAEAFYLDWMTELRPGDFNQALMDLGSAVCLPGTTPLCGQCPLQSCCRAHAHQQETAFPKVPEKAQRRQEQLTVFLIHDNARIALRKRPSRGLLAGLYEYPNVPGTLTEAEALRYVRTLGFSPLRILPLPPAKHVFTHKEWHMTGFDIFTADLFTTDLFTTDLPADELAGKSPAADSHRTDNRAAEDEAAVPANKKEEAASAASSPVILAELTEIRDRFSIPSAFSAYTETLQLQALPQS